MKRLERCARYVRRFSLQPDLDALADLLDRIAEHPALSEKTFQRAHRLIQRSA